MFDCKRSRRAGQWLALATVSITLAGCAPTVEHDSASLTPAPLTGATPAGTAAPAPRVATTQLGVDGYELSSRVRPEPELIDPEPITPQRGGYLGQPFKDRGLGVRPVRPQVEPSVDADDPEKYTLQAPLRESDQEGLASWYGEPFHGRLTASGERFDLNELTAAHRTLPFGTLVCVRNATSGKSVVVRINDRGPFVRGRVIDLSKAAAQELGMLGLGIKPVEIWHLEDDEDSCPEETVMSGGKARAAAPGAAAKAKTASTARKPGKVRPAAPKTQQKASKNR